MKDKDKIMVFLTQLKWIATAHQIPKEHWAINCSFILTGQASNVYYTLNDDDNDYKALKKELFVRFWILQEQYQKLFRDAVKIE